MRRKKWFRNLQRLRRGRPKKTKPALYGMARRNKRKIIPRRFLAFVMVIILAVTFVHSFYRFDRAIIPLVLEAAELRLQAEINNVINAVVQDIIRHNNVVAEDFIIQTNTGANGSPILSVNTVLVNEICNAAAKGISARLNNLDPEVVTVPMGMALGLDILAQRGPQFSFSLAPIGNALVNYESHFTAVGINQTHFSVWLTVESVVRIINPVHSTEIVVMRNVSLVDTVISGTVPEMYLNMEGQGGRLFP